MLDELLVLCYPRYKSEDIRDGISPIRFSHKIFVVSSCLFFFFFFLYAGIMTDELRNFLELNLPKVKGGKKVKFSLGVAEPKIGSHIFEVTKIPCQSNEFVHELLRGVRLHFERFIKDLKV